MMDRKSLRRLVKRIYITIFEQLMNILYLDLLQYYSSSPFCHVKARHMQLFTGLK